MSQTRGFSCPCVTMKETTGAFAWLLEFLCSASPHTRGCLSV